MANTQNKKHKQKPQNNNKTQKDNGGTESQEAERKRDGKG